jgi:hypothetical protein
MTKLDQAAVLNWRASALVVVMVTLLLAVLLYLLVQGSLVHFMMLGSLFGILIPLGFGLDSQRKLIAALKEALAKMREGAEAGRVP